MFLKISLFSGASEQGIGAPEELGRRCQHLYWQSRSGGFFSSSSNALYLEQIQVDEKLLYDTFSAFGVILTTPKIQRDPETGNSKGFAFINYASFEASDAAIEAMNGQYLCNR